MDHIADVLRVILRDDLVLDIWVDALCINQSDNGEKLHQIGLVAQIYTNACRVMMWLGEEEENTGLAFDLIRDAPQDNLLELVRDGNEKSKHWEALGILFARPYWSRVWIIQEVLLSAQMGIMCCGSFTMRYMRPARVFEKITSALLSVCTETLRSVI